MGGERSQAQSMGFFLKVLVLSRYSIVKKRYLFCSVLCCCTETVSGHLGLVLAGFLKSGFYHETSHNV